MQDKIRKLAEQEKCKKMTTLGQKNSLKLSWKQGK